jgi:HK97 family phage portal protein
MRLWPTRKRETPPDTPLDPDTILDWQAGAFGALLGGIPGSPPWSPRLADRVWVANRCMQLNCQQIASMPLRFFGASEPAWCSNPDPVWYPNGIDDAVFSAAWAMYSYGDAFLYVTDRYANGYPAAWTLLEPWSMNVTLVDGRREYRSAEVELNHEDVVQISRDSRGGLRGTSALWSYASVTWGMLGGAELARQLVGGAGTVPNAVLKSTRKLTQEQATAIQDQWVAARARSGVGAPAVLPPELEFQQLSFSAQDLELLNLQEYDARAIATAFGVPAYMMNMPLRGGLTYQNPETLFEVWWRTELRPASSKISRALSANMLPRGSWVEFDARAVLAPTFPNQVTAWLELQKEGVVTADEVRAAVLHLPPLAQGESITELTEPPIADASPADQQPTATVQELRPSMTVTAGGPLL